MTYNVGVFFMSGACMVCALSTAVIAKPVVKLLTRKFSRIAVGPQKGFKYFNQRRVRGSTGEPRSIVTGGQPILERIPHAELPLTISTIRGPFTRAPAKGGGSRCGVRIVRRWMVHEIERLSTEKQRVIVMPWNH